MCVCVFPLGIRMTTFSRVPHRSQMLTFCGEKVTCQHIAHLVISPFSPGKTSPNRVPARVLCDNYDWK